MVKGFGAAFGVIISGKLELGMTTYFYQRDTMAVFSWQLAVMNGAVFFFSER